MLVGTKVASYEQSKIAVAELEDMVSGVDTIVSPKSSLEMKSVSALSGNGLKNNSTSKGVY